MAMPEDPFASSVRTTSIDSLRNETQSYLINWLSTFETARLKGTRLLESCVARIAGELHQASPIPESEWSTVHMPIPIRSTAGFVSKPRRLAAAMPLFRRMWRQRQLLKQAFSIASEGPTGLVALSTKRLPLADAQSPRARLCAFARALPGTSDPHRIGNAINGCRCIFLFEPQRVSTLWENPQACWDEDVFILDYGFLGFNLATAPLKTIREIWAHRRHLLVGLRQRGVRRLKPVLAAIIFAVAYRGLLARIGRTQAFFFTSNSFATEVLRVSLLRMPECTEICELLHGVPSLDFEEYFTTLFRAAPSSDKHRFVPQIPSLPLCGAYSSLANAEPNFLVNAAVNRYFLDRDLRSTDLMSWIDQECERFAGPHDVPRRLILAVTGGTSQDKEYLRSSAFATEREVIRHVRATLAAAGQPFTLCYTPHPAHGRRIFNDIPFFAEQKVMIYPDTVFTWLVADLCIALYSSAMFEAAFAGATVFTPMRNDDGLFPPILLDRLNHPGPQDGCLDALTAFLRANARTPNEDLRLTARKRLARLAQIESPSAESSEQFTLSFKNHRMSLGKG